MGSYFHSGISSIQVAEEGNRLMRELKKLLWLECVNADEGTPLMLLGSYFLAAGFNVRFDYWVVYSGSLMKRIFSEIETWRPDIICVLFSKRIGEEPKEWIEFCQYIRSHPKLQHIKIMAFLYSHGVTSTQEAIRRKLYAFYTYDTKIFEDLELAKMAKQLVGEKLKGFEGVNFYLNNIDFKGNWKMLDYLQNDKSGIEELLPDAEGQFAKKPRTRLLIANGQGGYTWDKTGVQVGTLTYIVYFIKELQEWQVGLTDSEKGRLVQLAQTITPQQQLLIGVNDLLLQSGLTSIIQVIEQAQQAGGWQIFINEHLWREGLGWKVEKFYEEFNG